MIYNNSLNVAGGIVSVFSLSTWFFFGLAGLVFTLLAVWNANYYTGLCTFINLV